MKRTYYLFLYLFSNYLFAQIPSKDWLVKPIKQKAEIIVDGKNIILNNGLVKRAFRMEPNVACFDYTNLTNGSNY